MGASSLGRRFLSVDAGLRRWTSLIDEFRGCSGNQNYWFFVELARWWSISGIHIGGAFDSVVAVGSALNYQRWVHLSVLLVLSLWIGSGIRDKIKLGPISLRESSDLSRWLNWGFLLKKISVGLGGVCSDSGSLDLGQLWSSVEFVGMQGVLLCTQTWLAAVFVDAMLFSVWFLISSSVGPLRIVFMVSARASLVFAIYFVSRWT